HRSAPADLHTLSLHDALPILFALWNDKLGKKVSVPDVHDRIKKAMPTLAEKMWRGSSDDATFAEFQKLTDEIGLAPGTNLEHNVKSETDTVLHYTFDDGTPADTSGNNYDGTLHGAAITQDGTDG